MTKHRFAPVAPRRPHAFLTGPGSRPRARPGTRPGTRPLTLVALAALGALAWGAPALAQATLFVADERAAAIAGRVCADLDEDGACGPADIPLSGVDVAAAGGLSSRTDAQGRFHIAAAGAASRATLADGSLLPRPRSTWLRVDPHALGPTSRPPPAVYVDLTPAAVVPVELAVKLPVRSEAPPPRMAPDAYPVAVVLRPAARKDEDPLIGVDVPLDIAPGHALFVDGKRVDAHDIATGRALVRVALPGRQTSQSLVERAPDGRLRLARLDVLRVPRKVGGDLVIVRPLAVLATFDLPPAGTPSSPGPLLVPVAAPPGTVVDVGPRSSLGAPRSSATIDGSGRAWLWTQLVDGAPVRVHARSPVTVDSSEIVEAIADADVVVDALAGLSFTASGEVRAGGVGVAGAFAPYTQGRVDAALAVPFLDGDVAVGVALEDDLVSRALLDGTLLLQRDRPGLYGRAPDPELDLGVFGDGSTTSTTNPGELALWARARGSWGAAGVGPARTPLDHGEAGRFDRPVIGPYVDVTVPLGPARVGVEGAADASLAPGGVVVTAPLAKAHVELDATGGSLYWLAHGDVAPASERIFVELVDPLSTVVVDRRELVRGADYDIDYASGRILLAAPLGLAPPTFTSTAGPRFGAFGYGSQPRLVVDYAHFDLDGSVSSDAGARVSVSSGNVEAGVFAGASSSRARVIGADISANPSRLLSVSASVAQSAQQVLPGDVDADFARSLDGGLSFTPLPLEVNRFDAEGLALATSASARARFGTERSFVSAWALSNPASNGARALGAEGRLDLFGSGALSAVVNQRRALVGAVSFDPDVAAAAPFSAVDAVDVAARAEGWLDIGSGEGEPRVPDAYRVRLALDGLYRSATLESAQLGAPDVAGDASAAGAELGLVISRKTELFIAHLQQLSRTGDALAVPDPTLTSAGARLTLFPGRVVEARVGVHPDLRPEASVGVVVDEDAVSGARSPSGASHYATFGVTSDAPWSGSSVASVVGVRQRAGPNALVYSEQRTGSLGQSALSSLGGAALSRASVVGGDVFSGPWSLRLAYETGERVVDVGRTARHAVTGRAGLSLPRLDVHALGEFISLAQPPASAAEGTDARTVVVGAAAHARPLSALTFGARALLARGAAAGSFVQRPAAEVLVGGAWREPGLPAVFAQYSLRESARAALSFDDVGVVGVDPAGHVERLQILRASVAFGASPGPSLVVSGERAQHELVDNVAGAADAAAVIVDARLGWPVWLLEPALQVGARSVFGGDRVPELDGTLRAEAAVRLGPAAVGLGVVVVGYTGTGLEELTLTPAPPPVYVVIRGAFG